MEKIAKALAIIGTGLVLSGCYVPEDFTLGFDFKGDGHYKYAYKGNIVNGMAALAAAEGKLKDKDEDALKREVEGMTKIPGVKSAKYMGKGRTKVDIEEGKHVSNPLNLFDIFNVRQGKDEVVTLRGLAVKPEDLKQMKQIGINFTGTISVRLPNNVEVIETNATSKPSLFSGTYGWKIQNVGPGPVLKFRFKN